MLGLVKYSKEFQGTLSLLCFNCVCACAWICENMLKIPKAVGQIKDILFLSVDGTCIPEIAS